MAFYEIAGLRVEMETFGRTLTQARPYLAALQGGVPDIKITCDPQRILELNPGIETLEDGAYLGTGACFARKLLDFSGFQLHASGVLLEGKAYLFSAPSGTGKSTHTQRWCRLFGAAYLNDDKPAVRYVDGCWLAYGTPWSGKEDLSCPVGVPLGGIAYLERGTRNRIVREAPEDAVPLLFSQCVRLLSANKMDAQLALADRLLRQIPFYHLWCRDDDQSAWLSREVMVL